LLDRAVGSIDTNHAAAKDCIVRATALLEAEYTRSNRERPGEAQVFARGGLTPWQIRQVTRHVEASIGSNISAEECATIARLSTSHFRRAFKASFGETYYAWLSRRRVERAQEMMVMTDQPLCQIARQCGFADQSHFNRVFGRLVGPSPGSWRRLHSATGQALTPSAAHACRNHGRTVQRLPVVVPAHRRGVQAY
jgi:transcriptional regulator GlxA family with amidase domain